MALSPIYKARHTGAEIDDAVDNTTQLMEDVKNFYVKPTTGIGKTDLSQEVQDSLDKADSAFQKPAGGIDKADLSQSVQDSLNKADSALQEHQTIAEGSTNGTIAVDGEDVPVKGLGSAAYTDSTAYEVKGAAAEVDTKVTNLQTQVNNLGTTEAIPIATVDAVAKKVFGV